MKILTQYGAMVPSTSATDAAASTATDGSGGTGQASQAGATTEGQVAADKLQALLLPYVANALGVNAYGNVPAGDPSAAGIGQVTFPPSTQVAASAAALQNIQALMNSYGQGGPSGADGVVGTSLIAAAENGELPDLSGYTGSATAQSGGASATDASASGPVVTVANPLQNVDTSIASNQLPSDPSADAATDSSDAAGPPTVSNRTPQSSSLGTDSATSSFASLVSSNSENENKKCKGQKLKDGEQDNSKLLQSLGIKDVKTANRIAQMLNTDNQDVGTDGTPKQNIINLMAVLKQLNDAGQGKSTAADQARGQLTAIMGTVDGKKDGMLTTDFIGASNVAASFVTQFALNPSLTQFVEPSISTASVQSNPWPQ